jgi:hypothetical protein
MNSITAWLNLIPQQPFDFNLGGTVGVDLDIKNIPKINIGIDPLSVEIKPLSLEIKPLDINLAVTRLPLIDIQFGFRPMRFHFPVNMKLAICALGKEVLSFGTCGESMLVVEDYVPHQRELCS